MNRLPSLMGALLLGVLLIGALLLSCATIPTPATTERPYKTGDLTLVVRYTAKETCSCLFVMNMGEDYCRAWTRANPPVASWSADLQVKRVDANALGLWSAHAHFVDDDLGCVLDEQ